MSITTQSVRSYGTEHINNVGVTENTPFELAAAWEEMFIRKPMMTPISDVKMVHLVNPDDVCLVNNLKEGFKRRRRLADEAYKLRMRKYLAFGTWGMSDDEKELFAECGEGLQDLDEQVSAISYAIEKVLSRKAWKAEQNRHRLPEAYRDTEAMSFELPPLDAPHCKVITKLNRHLKIPMRMKKAALKLGYGIIVVNHPKTHTPAVYQLKRLGKPMLRTKELHNCGPDGMRALAKLMGFKPVGGDTQTLNMMQETKKVSWIDQRGKEKTAWPWLATYSSRLVEGVWHVTVARKRNPVCTPSSYWADETDGITRENPNRYVDKATGATLYLQPGDDGYTPPLTLSQLDYHLLCESADLAVEDETGEIVEYMNEEEEFLTGVPEREEASEFVDFDKFCEDDEELSLISECSRAMERSETGVTMSELQSQPFLMHIHNQIEEAQARLDLAIPNVVSDDDITPEMHEDMRTVKKFTYLDGIWNKYVGTNHDHAMIRYWYPNNYSFLYRSLDFCPQVVEIAGASFSPANEIDRPVVTEMDTMPVHRVVQFTYTPESRPEVLNRRKTEKARNSAKTFNRQALRNNTAAKCFEIAMDQMLSALRA